MNCANCDKLLEKREHAQAMVFQGHKYWPPSLCDVCARANMWPAGSVDALERLVTGKIDEAEKRRVFEVTKDWVRFTDGGDTSAPPPTLEASD